MNVDWLREVCLSFPGATEQIQWGSDLLFKVGGKMFAATPLEPAPVCLSFKAEPESFAQLTERPTSFLRLTWRERSGSGFKPRTLCRRMNSRSCCAILMTWYSRNFQRRHAMRSPTQSCWRARLEV